MKKQILTTVILIFVISTCVTGSVPKTLSYQGVVTDSNGNPKKDGEYKFTFSIFDDSISGKSLWSEEKTIQTKQGLFSTELGSVEPLTIPFDKQYWLQVEADGTVFPLRTKLTSAPYSFRADTAEVAKKADTAQIAKGLVDSYYTREQLRDSGEAKVHAGNIVNAPWLVDLPSHNHDTRYPRKSLDWVREGYSIEAMESGKEILDNGLYTYSWYSSALNRPSECNLGSALTFGGLGSHGKGQLLVGWGPETNNYLAFRSLRDAIDDWYPLKRIYHEGYKPKWDDIDSKPAEIAPISLSADWNTLNSNIINTAITNGPDGSKNYMGTNLKHKTASGYNFQLAGRDDKFFLRTQESSAWQPWRTIWHSGNFTPETQSSDIRFKTDIDSIHDPLKKVNALKGISFNWKHSDFPDRHFPEGRQIGVIAQEVERILPEVVKIDKDGYKSVAYSKLSALLIEAVKEQQKIVEDQNEEIEKHKDKIKKQEDKIAYQKTEIDSIKSRFKEYQKKSENRFKELEKTIYTIKSDMEKK